MTEAKDAGLTAQSVARLVEDRGSGFVRGLEMADVCFGDPSFEAALATELRAKPELIRLWALWSADQRWTPSAYVDGNVTGRYDAGYRHVRVHPDEASAVADFVRRTAAWLSRQEVIVWSD